MPGLDVAGTVAAVGAEVTRFAAGDEVFGIARGSFAEYAAAREDTLARKPAALSFEQAAAVAVSGLTALQGLRDAGRIQPGQKVLVIGASGGVGSYAVQLAKYFGAEVTGVCGTGQGRSGPLDRRRSRHRLHPRGFRRRPAALRPDPRHRREQPLSRLRRALTPRGTLVIAGGEGGPVDRGRAAAPRAGALRPGPPAADHVRLPAPPGRPRHAAPPPEGGQVIPVVDRTYPLAETPKAIRRLYAGHARGKIVITV